MPRRRPEAPAADVEPAAPIRVYPRWMIRRDMAEVLAIEAASFDFPWDEDEFLRHLRLPRYIGMVAEHGERIVGFMVYELLKGQIRVPDFATHPGFRRRGVGNQMVTKLVGKLSYHRRTRLVLSVRETNLRAQLFFRRQGFRATEILRDYHQDTGEAAYLMQYVLDDGPARPVKPAWAMEWDGTRDGRP